MEDFPGRGQSIESITGANLRIYRRTAQARETTNMYGSRACLALLCIALTVLDLTPALGQTNYTCDQAINLHSYALKVSVSICFSSV